MKGVSGVNDEPANREEGARTRRGKWWWLGLTCGLIPVALGALVLFFWVGDHVPRRDLWRVALGFLIALEAVYFAVAVVSLVAVPALSVVLWRARHRGTRRPAAARGLLLGVSLLIGLGVCETVAGFWQGRLAGPNLSPVDDDARGTQSQQSRRLFETGAVDLPLTFSEAGEAGDVHTVVVGESSAEGVPYNFWISVGRLVTWRLHEAIPARNFSLDVLASSGETLEAQHRKLAGLKRRPDVLIIYCGHNEFSARFPWSREVDHYLDKRQPTFVELLIDRVERTSPLCGLIRRTADKCRVAIPPPPEASRALVDLPAYTPTEYAALVADFQHRLDRIVAWADRLGTLPILIVPPGNDAGFEPNRSFLAAQTPYPEREAVAREFQAARQTEANDPSRSMATYRALLARHPGFAEAHYRLARLLERAGAWDEAYAHDIKARDNDGLPMRCPTPFQDAYRTVAARYPCILIDAQTYFHKIGRHGLLDDHLFHDVMHPSLRGQIALRSRSCKGSRPAAPLAGRKGCPRRCLTQRNAPSTSGSILTRGSASVSGVSWSTTCCHPCTMTPAAVAPSKTRSARPTTRSRPAPLPSRSACPTSASPKPSPWSPTRRC